MYTNIFLYFVLMGYPTTGIYGNNVRKCSLESDFLASELQL